MGAFSGEIYVKTQKENLLFSLKIIKIFSKSVTNYYFFYRVYI